MKHTRAKVSPAVRQIHPEAISVFKDALRQRAYSSKNAEVVGAEQYADGRVLMGLLHVAVEGLQVELQLPEVFRLEPPDLQLDRHQAVESPGRHCITRT